jgi:hypothetical protein
METSIIITKEMKLQIIERIGELYFLRLKRQRPELSIEEIYQLVIGLKD